MNVNCEIVQDLLPLYEDGVCSESSRAAIEEHLKTCETCRALKEGVPLIPEPEIILDTAEEEKKVVGSFKKVRRWWGLSLIAIVMIVPLLAASVNQFRGVGISFTNLDDIWTAKRFVSHLQNGRYEEAAAMYDFTDTYQDILSALEMTPESSMRQFERIEIDGEVWYMDENMIDDFRGDTDALDIWGRLIYNRYHGVMIPEGALLAVAEAEEGILTKLNNDIYECANGDCFRRLETPWGDFFVQQSSIEGWNLLDMDLTDYGNRFTMMPEAMYQEVQPAIEAEALAIYNRNQRDYSAVAEMTEEEFCEHMRKKYASELEEFIDGKVTITGGSYANTYRSGGESWQVELQVRAASGAQANDLEIILSTDGGTVSGVSYSYAYSIDYSWLRNLVEALQPYYLD